MIKKNTKKIPVLHVYRHVPWILRELTKITQLFAKVSRYFAKILPHFALFCEILVIICEGFAFMIIDEYIILPWQLK